MNMSNKALVYIINRYQGPAAIRKVTKRINNQHMYIPLPIIHDLQAGGTNA